MTALAAAFPQTSTLAQILAARAAQDPKMNMQDTMVFVFQAAIKVGMVGVLPAINKLLLPVGRKAGSIAGPSYTRMGTSLNARGEDANAVPNHFVTDSVEIFFDASDRQKLVDLAGKIDALLAMIQNGGDFGGYVSLRFSADTKANLGMQFGWTRNCAIEVTFFKGFDQNLPMLDQVQRFALANGGRVHWGQRNNTLSPADVANEYPKLTQWKLVRGKLTHDFTDKSFNNVFTARCGLDGPALQPSASIVVVKPIESHANLITHQTPGDGTFRISPVNMGPLAKVIWMGTTPGSTADGSAKLHFDNLGTTQAVYVEATDIYGDTVKASTTVPVVPGAPIGGPPTH
jgi:hypothetical protein